MPPVISLQSPFPRETMTRRAPEFRPKVSDEDDENDLPGHGATLQGSKRPPAIPQPRRSFMRAAVSGRARSLSRVYNIVPRDRPDFRQAQQDMIEYYAHLAMIETDVDRVQEEDCHLRDALHGCNVRRYGRLYSRLQIASLCISMGAMSTEPELEEAEVDEDESHAVKMMSHNLWKDLREQLIVVKSYMLRKDANMFVPIEREGYEDEDFPLQNDELDGVLEKHEMFQDSYKEVLLLLEVQEKLALLCNRIKKVNTSQDTAIKELGAAVDSYESSLQSLFMPDGMPEGANIGEKAKSSIPCELTEFLLHELYKKKPVEVIASLLKDVVNIIYNDESVFSLSQLKQKMKALLTKWSESILHVPKLVELGYGGVMAPISSTDEDDVSSYGVDEDHLLPADDPVEPEPVSLRNRNGRRTSFADEILTHPQSRHFPQKSPRSRSQDSRKVVRKKVSSRNFVGPPPLTVDSGPEDNDNDSHTEDPIATVHQNGGETVRPVTNSRGHPELFPIGEPPRSRTKSTPPRASPNGKNKRRRTPPAQNVDDLWEDSAGPKSPTRRRTDDWTSDETFAVKDGYQKFGDKYHMIKNNSMHRLCRRTCAQIKTKISALVKNGELEERMATV